MYSWDSIYKLYRNQNNNDRVIYLLSACRELFFNRGLNIDPILSAEGSRTAVRSALDSRSLPRDKTQRQIGGIVPT